MVKSGIYTISVTNTEYQLKLRSTSPFALPLALAVIKSCHHETSLTWNQSSGSRESSGSELSVRLSSSPSQSLFLSVWTKIELNFSVWYGAILVSTSMRCDFNIFGKNRIAPMPIPSRDEALEELHWGLIRVLLQPAHLLPCTSCGWCLFGQRFLLLWGEMHFVRL